MQNSFWGSQDWKMGKKEKFFHELQEADIQLNHLQREAVTHIGGPLVVFAGPGSGKTTVLTCRASYLMQVERIQPQNILIVTFTKAAAEEMKSRLAALPGIGTLKAQSCDVGTFHSIYLRILLRTYGNVPRLLEESEQRQIVRGILRSEGLDGNEEEIGDLLTKIGLCKNNLILPEQMKPQKKEYRDFKRRYNSYEAWKRENVRWDYDDILVECYRLLKTNRAAWQEFSNKYTHILVDEFQDTNYVQYEILKRLAGNSELCIVGDDDQSIYRFRGSRVDYLLTFDKDFPGARKVILSTNYRSTDSIIQTASSVINRNRKRETKNFAGTGKPGDLPVIEHPEDERKEAFSVLERALEHLGRGESADQLAVLYRTNLQVRALIDEMVRRKIPFCLRDHEGNFYHQWQVRDVLCYFRLALNPQDLDSLLQILNRPKRYMYPDSWMNVLPGHHQEGAGYLETLLKVPGLEAWKRRKLEELAWDLKKLPVMKPREALRFIRKQIGYDQFLEDYVQRSGQKKEFVFEPIEMLEQAVASSPSLADFLNHVQNVDSAIKQARYTTNGIQLMTFHKAKGLEFKTVFLIGLVKGMVPHVKSLKDKDATEALEEERRLFYVGITRAKEQLFLYASKRYRGEKAECSPFLDEIGVTERRV